MRIKITEQQFRRFVKGSLGLERNIIKYLNTYIVNGKRKTGIKSRNYGNLHEDWCISGRETISVTYTFGNDKFEEGTLYISKELVDVISELFMVRPSYILNIIVEWYDDTMVPKFKSITNESILQIDRIVIADKDYTCLEESTLPDNITDEEMIDFIYKNTGYNRREIVDKIESGDRDLKDFYLDIADMVARKELREY